jgi:Uma2 family endonuclease
MASGFSHADDGVQTVTDLASATLSTPDDVLTAPSPDGFEVVDGQLVEKRMGIVSSYVGGRLFHLLSRHLDAHPGGWVLPGDAGYRCFPGRPRLVRKPDVSFVRAGRFPGERLPRGDCTFAPDLAVEVVSPNDLFDEVDHKIVEYLGAGVRLVWVIGPEARTVHVYHAGGAALLVGDGQELDGGDVLPGFRCTLADLFPPRSEPNAADTDEPPPAAE